MSTLFGAQAREVAPGAVHIPAWLDLDQQIELVQQCREWARGPVPMRPGQTPGGRPMSVQTVWLGIRWTAEGYRRKSGDGVVVPEMPDALTSLAATAIQDVSAMTEHLRLDEHGIEMTKSFSPDMALVNFYDHAAKMGLHQDKDETCQAPIVSLSLGDTAVFRLGNTETKTKPWQDIELASGDLLVFGGPSRMAFHGVPMTRPGTADPALGLSGRLNITIRQTGLP
ncbi:alpha-ketoglutarate-dependent dioxygenase AlkB [Ornithinimicrobium sp. Arc0846-15]|nr:alpha-ketoglutarate-dependent dioxygenase AlkB [Ornithinimicrobium laminariae]